MIFAFWVLHIIDHTKCILTWNLMGFIFLLVIQIRQKSNFKYVAIVGPLLCLFIYLFIHLFIYLFIYIFLFFLFFFFFFFFLGGGWGWGGGCFVLFCTFDDLFGNCVTAQLWKCYFWSIFYGIPDTWLWCHVNFINHFFSAKAQYIFCFHAFVCTHI